jgi:hypothetical protein
MAITHLTAVRNALADLIDDLVNAGAGDNGTLALIESAGPTDIVEFDFNATAFGAASDGVITLADTPIEGTASASGTVNLFEVRDADGGVVYTGSVTESGGGGDLIIDNAEINATQSVNLTSHSYTAAP